MRLVDEKYLKPPKKEVHKDIIPKEVYRGIIIPKKVHRGIIIPKGLKLLIFLGFCCVMFYYFVEYVKRTPIKDPDLSFLPDNLRNNNFFRSISVKDEKRDMNDWSASNESDVLINYNHIF